MQYFVMTDDALIFVHGQEAAACMPEAHFGMYASASGKKVANMHAKNKSITLTNAP
jgi:hypothetical protein